MNISVERLPECKARLSAEIPADVVQRARSQIVAQYARQAKIPGFRPGKIPAGVVEKKYADQIEGELRERLATSAYQEVRSKESINILGIAQIEREQFEPDGSYLLAVEIVTEPQVDLVDYKEIPVEVTKITVTDDMVDGYLTNTRKQQAVPKDVDRAACPGDLAVIRYTGTLEGNSLEEKLDKEAGPLAKGEDHWVEVPEEGESAREFIPGISKSVVGMGAGDTKTFEAEFPADFPIEVIAGKTVSYELTVDQVKERELPELDDEFAKSLGAESVDDLKDKVRQQFEQQQERIRSQHIDNQILSHLNEETTFELPPHIVFNETQRQVNQMVSRGYEQGMTEADIEENQEDLLKNAETQARNNVKTMFLLDQIAKIEGITVSDDEISQRVMMMAMQQRRPVKKVARELRDNKAFGEIRQDILISKTIEFLRSSAKVTEVDPPEESPEARE